MAITTIEQLTLKEDAVGENDLLIIAEKNGNTYTTKSIKANAVGGGGGGGADDYVVSFTLTMDGGSSMSVTADHTAAEVYAAYQHQPQSTTASYPIPNSPELTTPPWAEARYRPSWR